MKTVLQKNTDSSKPAAKPFFGKSGKDGFFAKGESVPFFQPKLKVNQPGDQYEKEADAVADKVVENNFGNNSSSLEHTAPEAATPQISRLIQTQCSDCGEEELQRSEESGPEEEEHVQMKSDAAPTEVPDALESKLESTSGVGASLPEPVKNSMESGMGADFSGVRIHTGADAVQMSNDLNAQAFTHGNDIYFNEGKYQPENKEGQHLLAHELTHTVQQGGVGRKVQKSGEPGNPASTVPGPVTATNLDSGTFIPDDATAQQIEANRRGADVPVRFGNVASGNLRMEKRRETYRTQGGEHQSIPLQLPFLQPLVNAGVTPVLVVRIRENRVEGYVSIGTGRGTPNVSAFPNWLRQHPQEFGWLGLNVQRIPTVVNQIDAGNIRLEINGIPVRIGGFIDGQVSFGFVNQNLTFSGNAAINIPHCEPANITIERTEEGSLIAEGDLAVQIANFGGSVHARYENGVVNIRGAVRYDTEKLSGEVTLLVTDERTARNVARENLPPELINQSAMDAATGGESGTPPSGRRALAGWGEVDFRFTEWMTGRALVIIDNEGHVTIQGEITPPAEIELFPQRDFVRNIFTFEIRTLYGVPLVGNVFLFANIGMDALAKLGPAKIYNIRVAGTFSTDPAVFNAFSLQASLNVSAFAGLRLRAEGGVGVELLGHDIKAGIGVNALAGIRGYVEATPTIGYRENADPEAGREGEFYFNGHLEIGAQPFLGLGGDLFVELDAPWWSPLSDDRWTWPLGELEYPLPGEFGIGADLDYVLGSGEMPEITFGEVDFNSERFMTDLINDHVPPAQASDEEHQGSFTEAPSEETGSDAPQLTDTEGNPPEGQPATAHQEGQPATPPSPEVQRRFGEGMQALGQLAEQSETSPLDRAALEAALADIRTRFRFNRLTVRPQGQEWRVNAEMETLNNHNRALLIKGIISEEEAAVGENQTETQEENSQNVRQETLEDVNEVFGNTTHSLEETEALILRIENQLHGHGLKNLELEYDARSGDYTLFVEASPKFPLGKFTSRLVENIPRGRSVRTAVRLTLVRDVQINVGDIAVADNRTNVPRGGEVLSQGNVQRSRIIEAFTWNISNEEAGNNVSHAEHQFINWLSSREDLMAEIEYIELRNFSRSPCNICSPELAGLLEDIRELQRNVKGEVFLKGANLYWTALHTSAQGTSTYWHNISELRGAGWTLHAPFDAFPPQEEASASSVSGMLQWNPDTNAMMIRGREHNNTEPSAPGPVVRRRRS